MHSNRNNTISLVVATFVATAFLIGLPLHAEKIKKRITANYLYHIPRGESDEEAERHALQRARTEAIAKAFGTFVSNNSTSVYEQQNDQYYQGYFQLTDCDVRGEWISISGPKFDFGYDGNHERSVLVMEDGYAVKLGGDLNLDIRLLRSGLDIERNKVGTHDIYKDGDNMYLYFKSPVDGYLTLYIVDNDNISNPRVARLLPYPSENDGDAQPIKANHPYIFFSEDKAESELKEDTREIYMRCTNRDMDFNILYIIFSREPFTRCVDKSTEEDEVPTLRMKIFQKWLSNRLSSDHELMIDKIAIAISKE